jgi:hypothetical protein
MTLIKTSGLLIIALGTIFGPSVMRGVLPVSYFLSVGLLLMFFSPERTNDERVQQLKMKALFIVMSAGIVLSFVASLVMFSLFRGATPAPHRLDQVVSVWDFFAAVLAAALALFHLYRWSDSRPERSALKVYEHSMTGTTGGRYYAAPWSAGLKWSSWAVTILMAGIAVELGRRGGWLLAFAPLAFMSLVVFTMIRGYEIKGGVLRVRHLGWSTDLPLTGLVSVEAKPEAMRDCERMFGNGGAFSYSGRYRSEWLGPFQAYVSDPARSVVLSWGNRSIVVSPDSPEDFVRDVRSAT